MAKSNQNDGTAKLLGITRISLGLVFLWAFFDKLLGLGFATCRDAATQAVDVMCKTSWIEGGSPTTGFLKFGTSGPFADFYQGLAGNGFIDWLFMIGLLGIGLGLVFGIAMRLSTVGGILMMIMMYTAALWPANNPVIDDHIIYALVLAILWVSRNQQAFGFGKQWNKTSIVKKYPILQ